MIFFVISTSIGNMKFSINRDDAIAALSFCRTILRQTEGTILGHTMIVAGTDHITFLSHNLFASKQIAVPGKTFEPGETTMPLDQLYQIASGAPKGQVISVAVKDRATVTWGRSRYTLPILPVNDFPPPLAVPEKNAVALTEQERHDLFHRPSQLLINDQSALLYAGVWLHGRDKKLASIGSDGTRMLCTMASAPIGDLPPITVPREVAIELSKMPTDAIWWTDKVICARAGSGVLASKLYNVAYDHYERMVPGTDTPFLEFNRKELVSALARMSSLATHGSIVKLSWAAKPKSASLEFVRDGDGCEVISCSGTAPANEIGLAPIRTCDLFSILGGEKMRVHINAPMRPLRVVDLSEPNTLVMVAPCRAV